MAPSGDPINPPPTPTPPTPPNDDRLAIAIAEGVGRVVTASMEKLTSHMDASLSMFSSSITTSINSLKETLPQTPATGLRDTTTSTSNAISATQEMGTPQSNTFNAPFSFPPPVGPGANPFVPPLPASANPFVPPSTMNPAAGASSILRYFPEIEASVLQSVVKHELRPQHLHKLLTTTNTKPITPQSLIYTVDGFQVQEPSVTRELPTFNVFLKALTLYFDILSTNVLISTGNVTTYAHVAHGGYFYLRSLNHYLTIYTYRTVLDFHMVFHAKRLREMEDGDFTGWSRTDNEAVMQILQPSTAAVHSVTDCNSTSSPKPRGTKPNSPKVDQVCNNFNENRCTSPCRNGRIHKCSTCSSESHSRSACTTKST
ncbi:hypothetical protein PLEOSDRAFT_1109201 [Pleurotus ostreatus PC15]|uniref:Uncharacterized protein n=1 Tax=Pleurotus ostreatus (strain PC15) TaxID=1137138 RepID=A0A067N518_PLEO1|nr:hypothetical protein PLEOSDRAFT_1109201 [Pleurotus ostreatus PC15]